MEIYQVLVDRDLKEDIRYEDQSFPLEIFFDDYRFLVDQTLNCHWHGDFEFALVLRGAIDFYLNGVPISLSAGECVFVNSGILHMARQKKAAETALVEAVTFRAEMFTKGYAGSAFLPYFEGKTDGFQWNGQSEEGRAVIQALRELGELDKEAYGYELCCMSLLSRIWYHTAARMERELPARQPKSNNAGVKKILSYIHEHFQERIAIEDLIKYANMSRSEAFRSFKQYAGVSPIVYINDYRLSKAAALLAETEQNITEICFACGFTDTSYFVKLFREKYGVPPLKYRKLICTSYSERILSR
ncbi:MAG: AraC family transcriptional regulator [Lachnospiraceae bacterium]|nr:AraC family transcriptional regulator [Lachnospiraceae bacterium]